MGHVHAHREPDRSQKGAVVRPLVFLGDDGGLVHAIRAGQPEGAAALFDRYGSHVHRVLSRVLGFDAELPDLLHDVFAQALRSIDKLRDAAALERWLTSIAVFTARGHIRRKVRRRWLRLVPHEELPDAEAPTANEEVAEALRSTYAVLSELPVDERIAFALRFIEGMERAEVASACGVSLTTIKRRLARAEARFLELARAHPVLDAWVKGGSRWNES